MRAVGTVLLVGFLLSGSILAQESLARGEEFQVNTYTTGWQNTNSVGVSPDGRFVVIWNSLDQDGDSGGVFGQRFAADGTRAGVEFQVNTYTTGSQGSGAVAVGSTGDFMVVWSTGHRVSDGPDGSSSGVFGQLFLADGSPAGAEFLVNTYTPGPQHKPAIDADTAGNFLVVWDEADVMDPNARNRVFGQRFNASGAPIGSELALSGDENGNPDVAVAPSGQFVVVWQRTYYASSAAHEVFGRRFAADGSPMGNEFQVSTDNDPYRFVWPEVAIEAAGGFLVVWDDQSPDGSEVGVLARGFGPDGSPIGSEFQVNTFTAAYWPGPSATVSPHGGFVVVWSSYFQDGSYDGVFGRGMRGDGTPVSGEFQVNTYTTESQGAPAIASDDEGNFVVVWLSDQLDGSNSDIFGQRFSSLEVFVSAFETGDTSAWDLTVP